MVGVFLGVVVVVEGTSSDQSFLSLDILSSLSYPTQNFSSGWYPLLPNLRDFVYI